VAIYPAGESDKGNLLCSDVSADNTVEEKASAPLMCTGGDASIVLEVGKPVSQIRKYWISNKHCSLA
jgi:hypothetical protein